jgi:hypothetical protein
MVWSEEEEVREVSCGNQIVRGDCVVAIGLVEEEFQGTGTPFKTFG